MPAEINLLPQQEKIAEGAQTAGRKLKTFAVGLLVLTAILTIITLGLFAFYASKRSNLIAEIEENSASVNQYKLQEERLVVVKDKVGVVSSLIAARENYPNFFEVLATLVPQDVYFTDLKVSENKVAISGKARSSGAVAALVSGLLSERGIPIVNTIGIDSLSSDQTGTYSFIVSANLVNTQAPPVAEGGTAR
ncbi:MAG: PilN domain-containing protein [Candidatus Curtissbacteria bacterium]|nr:PilN domain-containing protein [Candidatus Curtissbacteria bacterium]